MTKKHQPLQHLAIVPDGSGRWAMQRDLNRSIGHQEGLKNLIHIVKGCSERHIKYLTMFTLSSDNMKRNKAEVDFLIQCAHHFSITQGDFLQNKNIKLLFIGDLEIISDSKVKQSIQDIMKLTQNNTGMVLNLMLNYSGQDDIVRACQRISQQVIDGKTSIDAIDRDVIKAESQLAHAPPVDFCIRTGGELRISNFCLWHIAYAELFFNNSLWPDFSLEELDQGIEEFQLRKRRFGQEAEL